MGGSRFRAWLEARLPWYSEHTERLRSVRSELIDRKALSGIEQARRIIADATDADDRVRRS